MKSISLFITIICVSIFAFSQNDKQSDLNLDFEQIENGHPVGWATYEDEYYKKSVDSVIVHSGKYSVSIEFAQEGGNFMSWTRNIPNNYDGKKITFSGYMKTENVEDGYAGLWMRIDPGVAFDNMKSKEIIGTNDWKKFKITLNMNPDETEGIYFGGLIHGKGKIWLDDLQITIDGKDIQKCKPYNFDELQVDMNNEFINGSNFIIESEKLSQNQIENLKNLGLIWGFLKYYHPNIAKGNFNWDYELFKILPKVYNLSDDAERDKIYIEWINNLGNFETKKSKETKNDDVKIKADLEWINNSSFSKELQNLLLEVKNAKRTKSNYYVSITPFIGNPKFKNEKKYSKMKYTDDGYKLLSLYRYWNIIQYYFPYKYLIEEDWKDVLEEFIPMFVGAKNEMDYSLSLLQIIARIHDTHANIWGGTYSVYKFHGINKCAVDIHFVDNQAVVVECYDNNLDDNEKLIPGDIITHINDTAVIDQINRRLIFTPASNYPTQLRDIKDIILRTNDSIINITYLRDGKSKSLQLKAYSYRKTFSMKSKSDDNECFKMLSDEIAYIDHGKFKKKDLHKYWNQIKNTKGLIIDDRNYPSDFIIFKLSGYLIQEHKEFVKFAKGSVEEPGLFTFKNSVKAGKKNFKNYEGKVIIIVNETTQSSAEYHAMAYRTHPNATVIGSTTAGADGNVSSFYLPGGIKTMITGIGVYYPDGSETQRIGIIPNIEVKPTVQGIKEGRDELLEKAIELINTK